MSEYGKEKDLGEILQELINYCALTGSYNPNIMIALPENTLNAFSSKLYPKERIGSFLGNEKIIKLYLVGGTVEFV